MEPLRALTKRFTELHPEADFKLEDTGAETGIVLVNVNQVDFGFISRDLYPEEAGKVVLLPMTGTGTAVAVNPSNSVKGLTRDQVRRIFSGQITDWGAVGGTAGHQIKLILREATSATRASFESYFFPEGKPTYPASSIGVVESREMYLAIRSLQDSIAMVTLQKSTEEDPTIRLLSLDGVAAKTSNVSSGTYPIRRPVYFITNNDPSKVKPGVRALIEFMKSPEGVQILSTF